MENNELEFQKLMFEFFKHLTTVNTATAVLVPPVAVALGLPFWPPVVALIFFALSVICGGWGMFSTARRVKDDDNSAPIPLLILASFFVVVGLVIVTWTAITERPSPSEIPRPSATRAPIKAALSDTAFAPLPNSNSTTTTAAVTTRVAPTPITVIKTAGLRNLKAEPISVRLH